MLLATSPIMKSHGILLPTYGVGSHRYTHAQGGVCPDCAFCPSPWMGRGLYPEPLEAVASSAPPRTPDQATCCPVVLRAFCIYHLTSSLGHTCPFPICPAVWGHSQNKDHVFSSMRHPRYSPVKRKTVISSNLCSLKSRNRKF